MVGSRFIPLLPWLLSAAVSGQGWTPLATVLLPQDGLAEEGHSVRISLHGDQLAIGQPFWQGRGVAMVFGRNAAGPETWEATHVLEGESSGDEQGRSVVLDGQGLFVASNDGLWYHELGNELWEESYVVNNTSTWDMAIVNGAVIACGPLVPGFEAALLKHFLPLAQGGHVLATGLAIESHSASVSSCLGRVIAYDPPHLVVADPCYSTTAGLAVSGLIRTFDAGAEGDTILTDADAGTYGGFWPFGEGAYLGMNFGRALALKGDTLFVGFGQALSGAAAHVEVFRKNSGAGWSRFKQVRVPADWSGPMIGDLGTAIQVVGNDLVVGTDHGLAFFTEVDTNWVLQHFEPLGGAVSSIAHDGDLLAASVPAMGQVYLFERSVTGVASPSEPLIGLRIFPNPAGEHTVVQAMDAQGVVKELRIIDAMGRVQEQIHWDGSTNLTLSATRYRSGLYILQAMDREGRMSGIGRILWTGH